MLHFKKILVALIVINFFVFFASQTWAVSCPLKTNVAYKAVGDKNVYYVTGSCTKQVFSGPSSLLSYFSWKQVKNVSKSILSRIPKDKAYIKVKKLPNGCLFNNPRCSSGYDCVNNACRLKTGCLYSNPACASGEECKNNICQAKGCYKNDAKCSSDEFCFRNNCVGINENLPSNIDNSKSFCKNDEVYISGSCQKASLNLVFYSHGYSKDELNKLVDKSISAFVLAGRLDSCKNRIRYHVVDDPCFPKDSSQLKFDNYFKENYGSNSVFFVHPMPFSFDDLSCAIYDHVAIVPTGNVGGVLHEVAHVVGLWDQYCYFPPEYNPPNQVNFSEADCVEATRLSSYCSIVPALSGYAIIKPYSCKGNLNNSGGRTVMGSALENTLISTSTFSFTEKEIQFIQAKIGCN